MTLVHAMIAYSERARVHLVSVNESGPTEPIAYCGQLLPYSEVWETGPGRLTCTRCFTKAAKDKRFHAEAECPDCGKFTTRPLAHLIWTHQWDRDEARWWVQQNAEVVSRRMVKK